MLLQYRVIYLFKTLSCVYVYIYIWRVYLQKQITPFFFFTIFKNRVFIMLSCFYCFIVLVSVSYFLT